MLSCGSGFNFVCIRIQIRLSDGLDPIQKSVQKINSACAISEMSNPINKPCYRVRFSNRIRIPAVHDP